MADQPYLYSVRIMGETPKHIREDDPELWDEIERDREPQDTDTEAVQRWLGGLLDEMEDQLNSLLPLAWYCKVIEDEKS